MHSFFIFKFIFFGTIFASSAFEGENDLIFDYLLHASGAKFCIFKLSKKAKCLFLTENWKNLKADELAEGIAAGNAFRINAIGNRERMGACIDKNVDEYLDWQYRENLLEECKGNGRNKFIKRVKKRMRKMENLFEKLINSNLKEFGGNLVKKMKIIWMLTNLYKFMKKEKRKGNSVANERRKKLELRWIREHVKIMLEEWFIGKNAEIGENGEAELLAIFRAFFTKSLYEEMLARADYRFENLNGNE